MLQYRAGLFLRLVAQFQGAHLYAGRNLARRHASECADDRGGDGNQNERRNGEKASGGRPARAMLSGMGN